MLGISGVSSDFRDLEKAAAEGNERAALAMDIFCYKVTKRIGSGAASMGGIDGVIFTAGVGENSPTIRAKIMEDLEFLGFKMDAQKNNTREEAIVSTDDSKGLVFVIPTNEELMIALDTARLVREAQA